MWKHKKENNQKSYKDKKKQLMKLKMNYKENQI